MTTYELTIPSESNYSISYNSDGSIKVSVSGNISSDNWKEKPSLRSLMKKHRYQEDVKYFGDVIFKFVGKKTISQEEVEEFFETLGEIKGVAKTDYNTYAAYFQEARDDPYSAKYFANEANGKKYKQWKVTATAPQPKESSDSDGWIIVRVPRKYANESKINNLFDRYGKVLEVYTVREGLYAVLVEEFQKDKDWLDKVLNRDIKKMDIKIRPMGEDELIVWVC